MFYFGVSFPGNKGPRNNSRDRQFPLSTTYKPSLYGVALSGIDGHFLDLSYKPGNTSALNLTAEARYKMSITSSNFTIAEQLCSGFGSGDRANMSNIAIACGYVLGAP